LEKTIQISGTSVRLKTSGAFPLRYKAQFHKDYFKELFRLMPLLKINEKTKSETNGEESKEENSEAAELQGFIDNLDLVDFDIFYQIVWTMAKTADPNIPEPLTWLDSFETFPIIEVIPQMQDMLVAMISTEKNSRAGIQPASH
jgi:hypothetical protein